MLRALFSVITILLLCVIALLLYNNHIRREAVSAPLAVQPQPVRTQPVVQAPPEVPAPQPIVQEPPVIPVTHPADEPRRFAEKAEPVPQPRRHAKEQVSKRTHLVQPGDTLWSISNTYFGRPDMVTKIAELNGLKSHVLRRGQVLFIPDETAEAKISGDDGSDRTSSTDTEEFEPQPPTLNVTRKRNP